MFSFFFNDTATTELYTLSLHDALPIFSQAEMAKILHVSQQTYSRYESHKTEIPLEKLVYLAKFFDTSVDYLLGVEKE